MFQTAYERELPWGHLVAVHLPPMTEETMDVDMKGLHPEEQTAAEKLLTRRQITWTGGRLAMAQALRAAGGRSCSILSDDRGAPCMPAGFVGSISHKDTMAMAMVSPDKGRTLGLDLEFLEPPRPRIARKILTPAEHEEIKALPAAEQWRATLLRFSLKEALYKAIDPLVRRYVAFKEVEVRPRSDGRAEIHMNLVQGEVLQAELSWFEEGGWLVSVVEAWVPNDGNSGL